MSPRSKQEYREAVYLRYKQASRREKTAILNEFCATCNCHRKHAIRVLKRFKRFTKPKPKKRGPKPRYQSDTIITPLKRIWLAANLPCSKRLKAILPLWIPGYNMQFWSLAPDVSQALLTISPATIDRILASTRIHYNKRGRATTKPGSLLKKQRYPSKPTSGMNPDRGSAKLILLPIAVNPPRVCSSIPSTLLISPPDGPNSVPSGEREKEESWNKSKISNKASHSLSWASIPITAWSSSITTSYDTSYKEHTPYILPAAEPTTKMTTPIWNRKTGPTYDNGSDMNDSINPTSSLSSMISIGTNGDSFTTSSAPPSNSSLKIESTQKPSNDTIHPKPGTRESWPLLTSSITQKNPCPNNCKNINPFLLRENMEKKLKRIFSYIKPG